MEKARQVRLGSASAQPGRVTWGSWIPVPEDPQSETAVAIAAGATEGPVLWIQGCLHGDEFDGAIVIQHLLSSINPDELRGTLIALPVANVAAFAAGQRDSPADGKDLNRQFPGDPAGSYSQRLAFALWSEIRERAGCLFDLHSSTDVYLGIPHAIYLDDGSGASRQSAELASRSELPVVWQSRGNWLASALYCRATQEGMPSVLLDVGALDHRWGDIERRVAGVINMLRHLGMLPGESRATKDHWVVREPAWVVAAAEGLLLDPAPIGTRVRKQQTLFRVVGIGGRVLQEATCDEDDGLVVTVRRAHVARPGREVMSVGQVLQAPVP